MNDVLLPVLGEALPIMLVLFGFWLLARKDKP